MSLKVSVSGVRGVWADSLSLPIIYQYAMAFACYVKSQGGKKILLGRDGRPTGATMVRFCSSLFNAMGLDTVDVGIVPTPTILFGVRECGFDAGVVFSASHNPLEWNAFKFVKKGGIFTDDNDLVIIKKYLEQALPQPSWDKVGSHSENTSILDAHIKAVLSIVDVSLIKKSGLKILLDPVNCSGAVATKPLLDALGVEAIYINDEPHGHFAHPAEPIPAHLTHLTELIHQHKVDVAFAQDPDADRLVVANEKGEVVSEEITPVLALLALLKRGERGNIVLNMSTSFAGAKLNAQYEGKAFRSKVGEANVVSLVAEKKAFYGIEGNGGVIYPKVNAARDSLVGIALILELLAREKKSLSQLISSLPASCILKQKYDFQGDLTALFTKMKGFFPEAMPNTEDGLRLDMPNGAWIHLRSSNTEPIVRLIAEAETETETKDLLAKVDACFK
ncbi:MAG: phosphoglucosamine mutase [Brevinema sp.]